MSLKSFCLSSAFVLSLGGVVAQADTSFVFTLNSGSFPSISATTPDTFQFEADNYFHSPVISQQIGNDTVESSLLFNAMSLDFASKDADLALSQTIFDGTSFVDGTYAALLYNDYPSQLSGIPEGAGLAGTLVISSQAPEPSSLLLLATGLVGVGAMARRRWMGAAQG